MAAIRFIEGKEVVWSDMSAQINGATITKIVDVKYGPKVKKEHLHAAGDEPISIQSGNREYTGSLKVLKSALDALNLAAVAAGGRDCLDVTFDIVINYKAKGVRPLMQTIIKSVEITEYSAGMAQGATSMQIDLPFLAMAVVTV